MRTLFPAHTVMACLCLFLFSKNSIAENTFVVADTSRLLAIEEFDANEVVVYEPVCANNGKTYINADAAKAGGEKALTKGRCSTYQPVKCEEPNHLWISNIDINGMSEKSKAEGYRKATHVIFDLNKFDSNIVSLYRQSNASEGLQQWMVWIDFDGDTVFEDEEKVVDEVAQDFATEIFIPNDVELGTLTRMRVFVGSRGDKLNSDSILLGEVEDYTVQIIK